MSGSKSHAKTAPARAGPAQVSRASVILSIDARKLTCVVGRRKSGPDLGGTVRPDRAYSERFPGEVPCRISIRLRNGDVLVNEKRDYKGFSTSPMDWEDVADKFKRLAAGRIDAALGAEIVAAAHDLDRIRVAEFADLLARIRIR